MQEGNWLAGRPHEEGIQRGVRKARKEKSTIRRKKTQQDTAVNDVVSGLNNGPDQNYRWNARTTVQIRTKKRDSHGEKRNQT